MKNLLEMLLILITGFLRLAKGPDKVSGNYQQVDNNTNAKKAHRGAILTVRHDGCRLLDRAGMFVAHINS